MIYEKIEGWWNWKTILILSIISNKTKSHKKTLIKLEGKTIKGLFWKIIWAT